MHSSPFIPETLPVLPSLSGVKLAAGACGIKYRNRTDVMLAELAPGTIVAGVFTQSTTASANVLWGRKLIKESGYARILLVNSGNANAFNGKAGEESVARIVQACAEKWGCKAEEIYPCATGVIGEVLPDALITDMLVHLQDALADDQWLSAAQAIMTTDTFPKLATVQADIDGVPVTINGIAKGSGMIAPNMATMLGYIFTDAVMDKTVLQTVFQEVVDKTFNSITVDSDTSTSDTALLFATQQAGNPLIDHVQDDRLADFRQKLYQLCLQLAHGVVKDGEGASKFVHITVAGAVNDASAKKIAFSIANSPLVKTAIAGEDANWGRIIMAIGKTGEIVDREILSIAIGGILISGQGVLFAQEAEERVTAHMKGRNVSIEVDLGQGDGVWQVWTCDFTHGYITINAHYRS